MGANTTPLVGLAGGAGAPAGRTTTPTPSPDPSAQIVGALENEIAALNKQNDALRHALANQLRETAAPPPAAADPGHPDHHSFRWGVFFGFLALAAVRSAPLVGALNGDQKIAAALQGGGSILGDLVQAEIAAGGQ